MFLNINSENEKINELYNGIIGLERTIQNKIVLSDHREFSSNIIDEYTFTNNNGEDITIPKRLKLNVKRYLDENNKTINDYPKGTIVNCNITCNKLWINNKYGIWWSVNDIQVQN